MAKDLELSLLKGLEHFVLVTDWESGLVRAESLRLLLELWEEEGEGAQRFLERRKQQLRKDLPVSRLDDGNLAFGKSGQIILTIPKSLLDIFARQIFEQPEGIRASRIIRVGHILGDWRELFTDHEKILGHLLLEHGEPCSELYLVDHDELVARHSTLHVSKGA